MEIAEIIEAVKGVKPEEFKDALQKDAQGHYQVMFNAGHSAATASGKDKLKALEGQVERLTASLASKDGELDELSKKKPDVEKLKGEYEQKLVEAQNALKAKEEEWKGKFDAKEKDRLRAELVSELQAQHVDPWAAQRVVDQAVMDRIHITDDGYKVYQQDGATPYSTADGQSSLSLLATEIVGTIPEAMIKTPRNNGSNYRGGSGEKGGNSTLKRSEATRQERVAYINEHGLEAWEALPLK